MSKAKSQYCIQRTKRLKKKQNEPKNEQRHVERNPKALTKRTLKYIIQFNKGGEIQHTGDSPDSRPPNTKAHMELDYEKAINLQGFWGYSPKTPLLDPQTENTQGTQPSVPNLVKEAIQTNSKG